MSLKAALPDVQNTADERGKHIQKTGITNYSIPFTVKMPDGGVQHTVGVVSMYTSLGAEVKGTNMSRFSQTIEKAVQHGAVSSDFVEEIVHVLKERLGSTDAYVKIKFPYFIKKTAPVSGNESHFRVDCELEARSFADAPIEKYLTVTVLYTSLCPCSRELSLLKNMNMLEDAEAPEQIPALRKVLSTTTIDTQVGVGAHNQRSSCKLTVHLQGMIWIEELVQLIEECASCPIWNTLKRPDEKYVTERAYNNPRFVEDMAREISLRMDKLIEAGRTDDFTAVCVHFESIHESDAVSVIKGGKCRIP
jgi:GTP cyclohydrolase I